MHPVRRRKKRPNYGVRTVEVKRGQNGFGFTISGQHPCILSCIVAGSPAESAGLRAGDYLVAVEGQSVSKVPHDDVVRLIGCSNGVLKLQIAENYYSDSSDDDIVIAARQKPKYPHKYHLTCRNTEIHSAGKPIREIRVGNNIFQDGSSIPYPLSPPRTLKQNEQQWRQENHVPPPVPRYHHATPNSDCQNIDDVEVFRAIVGYVGTIEMPRKLPPGSRLQIVRGCIKRLRAEKRSHTAVLMSVMTRSLRLTNGAGLTLAVYPGNRVVFCGASSDKDHKHFGVVTTASGEDPSSSCHIFAVDARPHSNHSKRAKIFKLECHLDPVSGICKEFPPNCDPIVAVIKGFYESGNVDEPVIANSPHPSNDSTTTTSNSDSGIGFRDDCGNQSDRILVVDVQNHKLHIQEVDKVGNKADKVTVHAIPSSSTATNGRCRSSLSTGSEGPCFVEDMSVSSGATKSPDVTIIQKCKKSFHELDNSMRFADDVSIISAKSHDALVLPYKLSPKTFASTSQSLEDLKETDGPHSLPRGHQPHWGSLQDLRTFNSSCFDRSAASQTLHEGHEEGVVSCWATSFEKLLEDRLGLQIFAEFLKKEFSHENIYFWVACERYRQITEEAIRKEKAKEIFERHLALGALEPVNVDSYARQVTEEQLEDAAPSLFLLAQKQIFNLMKFDSYPRFIKSDLYKECVVRALAGQELPIQRTCTELQLSLPHSHSKLKKSRSDADERRRKSLLPWTRKARAKSRDRCVSVYEHDNSSISSSRSSLTTWDVTLSSGLCRVILPDGSTAVVHTRSDQTVRDVITRLLLKRSLCYTDFLVFHNFSYKAISLDEEAYILSGLEVIVERRIIFRLDLPNRETIAVKARQGKTLNQVLKPILLKYGYRLEMVTLCLMSENEVLEPNMPITLVDNQRIQVLTRCTPTELSQIGGWRTDDCGKGKSLDEITNRVFEELLHGKAIATQSDQGSVRSEDWGSENSSGILGRFWRRESTFIDKQRKSKKTLSKCEENERKTTLSKFPPLIAKLKPSSKLQSRSESDVLYEGLKRAQRCRLEDQRGTEINFELPDFLKDKENTPQGGKKFRKIRDDESDTKFYTKTETGVSEENNFEEKEQRPSHETFVSLSSRLSEPPPPLPPKPKNIATCTCPKEKPRARSRRAVYLDQPSSSFV